METERYLNDSAYSGSRHADPGPFLDPLPSLRCHVVLRWEPLAELLTPVWVSSALCCGMNYGTEAGGGN